MPEPSDSVRHYLANKFQVDGRRNVKKEVFKNSRITESTILAEYRLVDCHNRVDHASSAMVSSRRVALPFVDWDRQLDSLCLGSKGDDLETAW